ncbi:hypothetical protein PsYK624_167840 [Phanerochaete sordida]|uniref:Uncharacterized protein n=1 Tax=Phanerochaete sordida TaxID=48140 RepID=A0A9P3LNJ1_9APHY|nr:hypothetical protein PsYK624_167840 [Phanerochaete sordida]
MAFAYPILSSSTMVGHPLYSTAEDSRQSLEELCGFRYISGTCLDDAQALRPPVEVDAASGQTVGESGFDVVASFLSHLATTGDALALTPQTGLEKVTKKKHNTLSSRKRRQLKDKAKKAGIVAAKIAVQKEAVKQKVKERKRDYSPTTVGMSTRQQEIGEADDGGQGSNV